MTTLRDREELLMVASTLLAARISNASIVDKLKKPDVLAAIEMAEQLIEAVDLVMPEEEMGQDPYVHEMPPYGQPSGQRIEPHTPPSPKQPEPAPSLHAAALRTTPPPFEPPAPYLPPARPPLAGPGAAHPANQSAKPSTE